MQVIFDRGTSSQRSLALDNLTERPLEGRITGSRTINIKGGGSVPDLSPFMDDRGFSTITVVSDSGAEIPITCQANYIADLSATYIEPDGVYVISITLTTLEVA